MSFPFTVPLSSKDVRTATSDQRAPLGTRGATADGRIYRYAKNGATALVKSYLVQMKATTAGASAWDNATLSYISTQWPSGSTAIGTTWNYVPVSVTKDSSLTAAKDYFADGYLWVKGTSTESGQLVRIKGNDVMATSTTTLVKVYMEQGEAFSEIVDSGSFVALLENEYDGVIVSVAAAPTNRVLGVPNADITASYYFWLQTWGVCAVRLDGGVTESGTPVWTSTQTAGTVQGVTNSTDILGTARVGVEVGTPVGSTNQAASETPLVHLTLSP